MSDQKKAPQLFHSDLFSSPSGIGSSGLSLGFDEQFSSPFSLAPASKPDGKWSVLYLETIPRLAAPPVLVASRSPASSQSSKVSPGCTPPRSDSPKIDGRSKSPSLTGQQQVTAAAPSSGTVSLSELSTVPLDSPVNSNTMQRCC